MEKFDVGHFKEEHFGPLLASWTHTVKCQSRPSRHFKHHFKKSKRNEIDNSTIIKYFGPDIDSN